jgi:hypothetical protein
MLKIVQDVGCIGCYQANNPKSQSDCHRGHEAHSAIPTGFGDKYAWENKDVPNKHTKEYQFLAKRVAHPVCDSVQMVLNDRNQKDDQEDHGAISFSASCEFF